MKAYLVPKKGGGSFSLPPAGSAEPDKVLSEVDDMLTKDVVPRERLVGKEWWAALETALALSAPDPPLHPRRKSAEMPAYVLSQV
jgi:hypothetical protein